MKKVLSVILAALMLASFAMSAFAATPDLVNSVGSVAADSGAAPFEPVGKDRTQGKISEYTNAVDNSTATNETRTDSVDVYATQASTYSVKIPKTIILNGANGTGAFKVSVKGNISGNQTVKVIPPASFTLSEVASISPKAGVTATINQTKTAWTTSEITATNWNEVDCSISAPSITAGRWNGTFEFAISIENAA